MIRLPRQPLFLLFLFAASSAPALAHPKLLEEYRSDEYGRQDAASCNLCHMSQSGAGERNAFGLAFAADGEKFTPLLRAQFSSNFAYPISRVNDTLTIHFSDPDHKTLVVESNGKMHVVDAAKSSVDAGAETAPEHLAATAPIQTPPEASTVPIDPDAREGAFFGQNVVDLPNGKPQKKGGVDFWIGHRFPGNAFHGSARDLFGFDGFATAAFGFRAGLTDRLSVSLVRSNSLRTIELGSSFQLSRQGGRMPFTLQVRGSVEGRDNFHLSKDLPWTGYAPSIQFVAVKTIADRLSLLAAPTFAFNTRDERFPAALAFGASSNNTAAVGMAAGFRVLQTTSLIAEIVPRVHGFRGERFDHPEISFGVKKSGYRNTFQFNFSNTRPMTTSRALVRATDVFGIGFNVYRKLR